jgi:hypothetical protein
VSELHPARNESSTFIILKSIIIRYCRDPTAIAKLPPGDQAACEKPWDYVAVLVKC